MQFLTVVSTQETTEVVARMKRLAPKVLHKVHEIPIPDKDQVMIVISDIDRSTQVLLQTAVFGQSMLLLAVENLNEIPGVSTQIALASA